MVAAALLQAERRQEGEDHDAHRNPYPATTVLPKVAMMRMSPSMPPC